MFSAKQQKNPVSRTISAPERKGVRQFARDYDPSGKIPMRNVGLFNGELLNYKGEIFFAEYSPGTELQSRHFSGCYMAAFEFIRQPEQVDPVFVDGNVKERTPYIAHVYASAEINEDTKYVFGDLESRGLIYIHSWIKPYDRNRDSAFDGPRGPLEGFESGLGAAMSFQGEWASVIDRNRKQTIGWEARTFKHRRDGSDIPHKHFNPQEVDEETYFNKGNFGVIINRIAYSRLMSYQKKAYNKGLKEYGKKGFTIDAKYLSWLSADSKDSYEEGLPRIYQQ